MKYQVELLSCLTYKNKDGELSTRLGYRLLNPTFLQDSPKFKGYSEMSYFCDGTSLFDKLKKNHFGVPAELTTEEKPNPSNPLKKVVVVKSIKIENELINLL